MNNMFLKGRYNAYRKPTTQTKCLRINKTSLKPLQVHLACSVELCIGERKDKKRKEGRNE
jgi:hypothetical protein